MKLRLLALSMLVSIQTPQVNSGVIEGRVTRLGLSDGISGVQITLIGPSPATTEFSQRGTATTTQNPGIQLPQTSLVTDSGGSFVFRNLAPGRYQILAQRDGYFGLPSSGPAPFGIVRTVTATMTLTAGQPAAPVSIVMLRGAIIGGQVRDPNGQPLLVTEVTAFQIDYQNGRKMLRQINSKQTDDRGEYRIFWLPPGDYMIAAGRLAGGPSNPQNKYARTFFPNAIDGRNAQTIHVAEGAEISGIDIGVRSVATERISGRAVTSWTGQPPNLSIFYLISSDPSSIETGLTTIPSSSSNLTNGQFELQGIVPGQYELFSSVPNGATLPPNAYIADVKAGGTSVFDSGFNVNGQTDEIQVLVNTNGGKVQGRVVDVLQKPFASAQVALVPRESRRQNIQLYKTATSDASGNFTINGIAPGDYKLFAWETTPNTAWMNPEFLAPYESHGLAVTVTATGSTPSMIDLKLAPKE